MLHPYYVFFSKKARTKQPSFISLHFPFKLGFKDDSSTILQNFTKKKYIYIELKMIGFSKYGLDTRGLENYS